MTEPTWTPEPGPDGVRWTLDPFTSQVLDLMARNFTLAEARKLVAMKMSGEGEKDERDQQ